MKTPRLCPGFLRLRGLEKVGVLSLPSERLCIRVGTVVALWLRAGRVSLPSGELQAALGATFCDLAVSPTSPAWRGKEDEEAKAPSRDDALGKAGAGGSGLGGRHPKGAHPGRSKKGSPELYPL